MLIFFTILVFILISFILITMPYKFRLEKKLNLVRQFEEISEIENDDIEFIDKNKINEYLKIEIKYFESRYVDEIMRAIVISNNGIPSKSQPTILFLHGLRDCADDWIDRAKLLENYLYLLEEKKIEPMNLVLLDSGYNGTSWFSNFQNIKNKKYEEFIVKDFIPNLEKDLGKISGIAGFSMGGYAAFKIGLKNRKHFKVIGSFSGAISFIRMMVNRRIIRLFKFLYIPRLFIQGNEKKNFIDIFGSWGYKILKEDPYSMIKTFSKERLKNNFFYLSVGKEDFRNHLMLQQWLDMIIRMKKHKINFSGNLCLRESHTWEYVSRDLKNFLIYFYNITK